MALFDQAGLAPVQAFIAGAPDLIAKLQAAGMADEAVLIQGAHGVLSDSITQVGSVIQADFEPVVEQLAAFNANVAMLIGLLQSLKDDGIPVSGMLGGKKS